MLDIRSRIRQRAQSIRQDRQRGLWSRLYQWLRGPDVDREVLERLRQQEKSQAEANREFPWDHRDLLAGGRRERMTGKKAQASGFWEGEGHVRAMLNED